MTTEAEQTEAPAAPAPVARIVGGPARSEAVQLTWPVEYDGKTYTEITVRRLTVGEIASYIEAQQQGDTPPAGAAKAFHLFPIMFDAPSPVLDAIDPNDDESLREVEQRFLPRRFQTAPANEPTPETGSASPQT